MLPHGYIFKFKDDHICDPNGRITEPLSDLDIIIHNTKIAVMEVESAMKTGKATFYITYKINENGLKSYSVGTWDDTYNWPAVVKTSWHNFAGPDGRRDCWFKIKDQLWHGVNIGDDQIVHAKRIRSRG